MADEPKRLTPPYGAFETLKNALEGFAQAIPHRVDRSAFPGLAWNATSRLLIGLRFLALTDDEGTPTPALFAVADTRDEVDRKRELEKVLRRAYAEVFKLDLTRMTPSLLAETIGEQYNAVGDTRDKAVRFFLAACAYVGIPVSPLLSRERRPGRQARPKARTQTRKVITTAPAIFHQVSGPLSGPTRKITLESGGTITLSAAVDFLTLSATDRAFVFQLIDKLSEYEHTNAVITSIDEESDDE